MRTDNQGSQLPGAWRVRYWYCLERRVFLSLLSNLFDVETVSLLKQTIMSIMDIT